MPSPKPFGTLFNISSITQSNLLLNVTHLTSKPIVLIQRERGQWVVYSTSPQKTYNNVFLLVGFKTLGTLVNFDRLFKFSVQTFQELILIYILRNFVYHHWGMNINLSTIVLFL